MGLLASTNEIQPLQHRVVHVIWVYAMVTIS